MKLSNREVIAISAFVPLMYLLISALSPQPTTSDQPLRSTFPRTVAQPRDCP